jgi:hypothetical protein
MSHPAGISHCTCSQVIQILKDLHTNFDHPGMVKMWDLFSQKYYFPRVREYIQALVHACDACFANRLDTPSLPPLRAWKKSSEPYELWYVDYKILENGWCLLNIICHWSKFLWSAIWPNETVVNVLQLLAEIKNSGYFITPKRFFSDNGTHFKNNPLELWCAENNVEKDEGAPYWPQGQGVVEKVNGTIANRVCLHLLHTPATDGAIAPTPNVDPNFAHVSPALLSATL